MFKLKKREMDWQLVASYFTVKSTDIFCSACIIEFWTLLRTPIPGYSNDGMPPIFLPMRQSLFYFSGAGKFMLSCPWAETAHMRR